MSYSNIRWSLKSSVETFKSQLVKVKTEDSEETEEETDLMWRLSNAKNEVIAYLKLDFLLRRLQESFMAYTVTQQSSIESPQGMELEAVERLIAEKVPDLAFNLSIYEDTLKEFQLWTSGQHSDIQGPKPVVVVPIDFLSPGWQPPQSAIALQECHFKALPESDDAPKWEEEIDNRVSEFKEISLECPYDLLESLKLSYEESEGR